MNSIWPWGAKNLKRTFLKGSLLTWFIKSEKHHHMVAVLLSPGPHGRWIIHGRWLGPQPRRKQWSVDCTWIRHGSRYSGLVRDFWSRLMVRGCLKLSLHEWMIILLIYHLENYKLFKTWRISLIRMMDNTFRRTMR